ncbi:MAG: V-type ATPase subunit [Deltaproteobacteria bacterium]|nr:V-type ATPase subunit [Deltaproteobacteria bacterium]
MDLSYFNARLRGMRGRLIRKADYDGFAALPGLEQYAERLRATAYGPYVETASSRMERLDDIIAAAIRAGLAASFADMQDAAPPEAAVYIRSLLSVWEVYDLKAIVRAVSRAIKPEEALDTLVPAGEFDNAAIKTLLTNSKDVPDLVSFLETWGSRYARPLKDGLAAYGKNGSTAAMEHNLDAVGVAAALKELPASSTDAAVIRWIIASRIDAQNVMTLLKVCGEGAVGMDAALLFLDGGTRLGRKTFSSLIASKDRDELLAALASALDDAGWKAVIAGADADEPGLLEEQLNCAGDAHLRRLAVIEPLSIALAASYMQMKAREAKNLRVIARGIAFGIPDEVLKRYIVYPM